MILNKLFQERGSLSIVLCLFIHKISSKHDRDTTVKLSLMLLTLHVSTCTSMKQPL